MSFASDFLTQALSGTYGILSEYLRSLPVTTENEEILHRAMLQLLSVIENVDIIIEWDDETLWDNEPMNEDE